MLVQFSEEEGLPETAGRYPSRWQLQLLAIFNFLTLPPKLEYNYFISTGQFTWHVLEKKNGSVLIFFCE